MPDIVIRLLVVVLVSLLTWLLVWSGRRFVEARRQRVLAAPVSERESTANFIDSNASLAPVRILAFGSADCQQCHRLQKPALNRLLEKRGESISVMEIDAPSAPEMTQRYQVLTLPTTVVLDAKGKAHAINYGFANLQRLLEQVDNVMALQDVH